MNICLPAHVRIKAATPAQMDKFVAYAREQLGYPADDTTSAAVIVCEAMMELTTDDVDWLWSAIKNPEFGLHLTFWTDGFEAKTEDE